MGCTLALPRRGEDACRASTQTKGKGKGKGALSAGVPTSIQSQHIETTNSEKPTTHANLDLSTNVSTCPLAFNKFENPTQFTNARHSPPLHLRLILRLHLPQLGHLPLRPTVHLILILHRPDLPHNQRYFLRPDDEGERSPDTCSKSSWWVSQRRKLSNRSKASCKYLTSLLSLSCVPHETTKDEGDVARTSSCKQSSDLEEM